MVNYQINYTDEILSKYKTFVLYYYKHIDDSINDKYKCHLLRPSESSYEEFIDTSRFRCISIDGALLSFSYDTSISEILIECALRGINIDFIDIMVENDHKTSTFDSNEIRLQTIDLHKEKIEKYFDKISAPRFYIAKSKKKNDILKYLVIDSNKQDLNVDFIKGEYKNEAVIAGFISNNAAKNYIEKIIES